MDNEELRKLIWVKDKDDMDHWKDISENAVLELVTLKHVLRTLIDLLEEKGILTLRDVNAAMALTMNEREEIIREMLE